MSKPLSDMTIEELWQLFPIFLVPHKAEWAQWFEEEAAAIRQLLPASKIKALTHIGSTAIPGIWAKDIVDILLETPSIEDMREIKECLAENGWLCMSESDTRISLNKGYTPEGFADKVFHLHLRLCGDADEIWFKDYLCAHPDTALAYQKLKLSLWKQFEHDRDGYTTAKSEFIMRITALARNRGM